MRLTLRIDLIVPSPDLEGSLSEQNFMQNDSERVDVAFRSALEKLL